MNALKEFIASKGIEDMPLNFDERDWMKWAQASFYDIPKCGEKLLKHIEWL